MRVLPNFLKATTKITSQTVSGATLKAIVGLLVMGALPAAAETAKAGDFALLDHTGRHHQLSYYGDHDAIVLMTHRVGDAEATADAKKLSTIMATQDNVKAFLLNPVPTDGRDAIARDAETAALDLPVLVDDAQLVARSLGMTRIGEVVVVAGADQTITYRGEIAGVAAALSGETASQAPLKGEPITYVAQTASYSKDIAPMLEANCVACHRDGGIAPWSMTSHAMVQGWSPMMREVVLNRRMPPGQIDTHVSRPIEGVAGLTVEERQKLVQWIDAGAPKDGDIDPLTQLTFSQSKFSLGEPDLLYTVPAQEIPATGVIDYRYVPVELNLDEDVWISAMEFAPGDRQVLHHVIAYLSSPADKTKRGRDGGADQGEQIAGFAPGRQPDQFGANAGRLIPAGSNLLLQMHYTTSGKATVDETTVGIYLHDKPPEYVMSSGVAGQRRFLVPPHAKEYKLEGDQKIERDAYLYQMTPHMHYRGKYMKYYAVFPDGKEELILSVPKYDFNWQFSYPLEEPLFLPAGSRLIARGAMDNSDRNPGNPDPTRPVHFGLQTKHEMFFGFTTLRFVDEDQTATVGSE